MHKKRALPLAQLNAQFSEGKLSAAELCASLLLTQISSLQKKRLISGFSTPSVIIQQLNDFHWVGHTDRIRRALIQWHTGKYSLILLRSIPTPFEILQYQARGERVVTVFEKPEDWQKNWGPHSAWEFVAHDLIHADHFFENPARRESQKKFYQFLLEHWSTPEIQSLVGDPGFDYLISDMNSHEKHLFQTLKAVVIAQQKKTLRLSAQERLPEFTEHSCQQLFSHWEQQLFSV